MRLIDADALIEHCKRIVSAAWNNKVAPISWSQAYQEFISELEDAPTIEAEPVRHGDWLRLERDKFKCSSCEIECYTATVMNAPNYKYCPNCGGKMDGGTK